MMREIRGQFHKLFRTRSGLKFYGEFGVPPTASGQMNYRPRRSLTVSDVSLVKTGDVVRTDNAQYLVALSNSYSATRQYLAFEITHMVSWSRKVRHEDFVTGLAKDEVVQILDPALPVVVEHGSVVSNLGLEDDKYRILTGADVMVGDRLGAWIVQTKVEMLGLNMLEVS
jgi:hypothetical protein